MSAIVNLNDWVRYALECSNDREFIRRAYEAAR